MNRVRLTGKMNKILYLPLTLIVLLIGANVLVWFTNRTAGLLMAAALVLYLLLLLVISIRQRSLFLNELMTFAAEYGQIQKQLLLDFPQPYAITDERGRFLWFNNAFASLTGKDRKTFRKSITGIFPQINIDHFPETGEQLTQDLEFQDRRYRVVIKSVVMDALVDESELIEREPEDSTCIYSILFFDETDLREYIQKYEDETLVCGLIYLDNYDEALVSVEEVRRSLLSALIDRKINKYFQDLDGIVKKYERDRYLILMRNRSLQELKLSKFDILSDVKTVNIGNEMAVTLSIGIGAGNSSYIRNFEYAGTAIDLALGRGGDQVVIKDGDSIIYFGGKTQAVEKNTRVKARVKARALQEFIESSAKVVIMGHKLLDIDAFGAAVGLARAVMTLDKKAYILIDSPTSSTTPFINYFRNSPDHDPHMFLDIQGAVDMVGEDTLLIVVDTNKADYVGCEELLTKTQTIVVLDHHRQDKNNIRNTVLSYVEPYASSSCEMVAEILQYFEEEIRLRNIEADTLYAGMLVDTNSFIQRTGVRTFEAAAYLRRCGADVTRVRKMFRENEEDFRAKGEALRSAQMYRDHYMIAVCPGKGLESPTIVGSQIADQLLDIRDVMASFVLTEYKDMIYISARAIDEVNVQIIMERMGGGGHLNMAGAQLFEVTIEEARRRLMSVLDEMIDGGEI